MMLFRNFKSIEPKLWNVDGIGHKYYLYDIIDHLGITARTFDE